MKVYIVFYYNGFQEAWTVDNVYRNRADADERAEEYGGYVLTREVL